MITTVQYKYRYGYSTRTVRASATGTSHRWATTNYHTSSPSNLRQFPGKKGEKKKISKLKHPPPYLESVRG